MESRIQKRYKTIVPIYRSGHIDWVIAICGDEKYLYTSSHDKTVRIWDKNTFKELATLKVSRSQIESLFVDERFIYIGARDVGARYRCLSVLSKHDLKEIATLEGHYGNITGIYSDEKYIYSVGQDNFIKIWDKKNFNEIAALEAEKKYYNNYIKGDKIKCSVCDKEIEEIDEKLIYRTMRDRKLPGETSHLMHIHITFNFCSETCAEEFYKEQETWQCSFITVFVDHEYIYGGSKDKVVKIWDKETFKEKTTLFGHNKQVNTVFADETYIFTGSSDNSLKIWDRNSFKEIVTLTGHENWVLAIVSDNNYIYSASLDNTIKIWDRTTFKEIKTLSGHSQGVESILVDDNYIYSASRDSSIKIWDKNNFSEITSLKGPIIKFKGIFLDEKYIYSAINYKDVKIWDRKTFQEITELKGHIGSIQAIYSDKNYIYSGANDNNLKIWDKQNFSEIINLENDLPRKIFTDEKFIYAAADKKQGSFHWYGGIVNVWNKQIFKKISRLESNYSYCYDVITDEKYIYVAFHDRAAEIWDKKDFKKIKTLQEHIPTVLSILIDDERIYCGSGKGNVKIWDKETYQEIITLKGCEDQISAVYIDSKFIYGGSEYGKVIIWDRQNFKENQVIDSPLENIIFFTGGFAGTIAGHICLIFYDEVPSEFSDFFVKVKTGKAPICITSDSKCVIITPEGKRFFQENYKRNSSIKK